MWKVSTPRPDGIRLVFRGGDALDAVNAGEAKASALLAIGPATDLVVDLSGIEFIDSAGVSVLVALFKAMRLRGGRARFCAPRPGVRSILEILRLDGIFEILDDPLSA